MRILLIAFLLVAVLGGVLAYLASSPSSLRAEFAREVVRALADSNTTSVKTPDPASGSTTLLTDADLAGLPSAVRRYVQLSGAVGRPRVRNFRARFRGRIRSGPTARWMPFTGEQVNTIDPAARLFYMDARMLGIPTQVLHRFVGPSATMRVRVASVFTAVDAKGPAMDAAETVTLFNDLCVMAPGAMIDPRIAWQEVDPLTVDATFTHLGRTVRARLTFNALGELRDFVADGRGAVSRDGLTFTPTRWSTPLHEYRDFGSARLMSRGEGVWHPASGEFAYLQFDLLEIAYNVSER
jgi:hypothetical protein